MQDSQRELIPIRYAPQFIPQCARWLFEEFGSINPDATVETAIQNFGKRANFESLPIGYVAVESGRPVGTISLLLTEWPEDELGPWISGVYVPPLDRRRKIASFMVSAVNKDLVRLGYSYVMLRTIIPEFYSDLKFKIHSTDSKGNIIMKRISG